ncbi:MAG: polyprenyl synthetase family protein [Boseongicola sp.]|nr:polyprenyl synthetase family protein [Boseongicola sp.]MDD9978906.1 polyprenyl synthetase family protein [Boseongicola sp.]
MSFEDRLKSVAAEVDATLDGYLDADTSTIEEAMRYAVLGGKKLRGFLVVESCALHAVPKNEALKAAAAIECIHAYSLVHDDLPCMDDDDLRRGKPTLHKQWDEATAVLAGDALQTLAFEILADLNLPAESRVNAIRKLARASGKDGMVLGQALDIAAESATAPLSLDQIKRLQAHKTGCLIEWSATAGAVLAGADAGPLQAYANALGLAFQIADDILDETGDEAKAGKRLKKDADAGKATFVSHYGLEGAQDMARALVADAIDALSLYDAQADHLRDAAKFVISREH